MSNLLKAIIMDQDKSFSGCLLKPVVWGVSLVFCAVVVIRRFLYQYKFMGAVKAACPVISIGNITAGGVGKTPLVIFVAGYLMAKGKRPVILTRGYMGPKAHKDAGSDEALMMAERLKDATVMVGPDRARSVRDAQKKALPDLFIMDDGFQHLRLKRDLDIVAIDARNPFGNGFLLPRGLLREPLSALAGADIFMLTRTDLGHANVLDLVRKLRRINPQALIVETVHAPVAVTDLLTKDKVEGTGLLQDRVVGVCAIGSPDAFAETLKRNGAVVEKLFAFDDHHVYDSKDLEAVVRFCQGHGIRKVVTTHKDAVKMGCYSHCFSGIRFLVLEMDIKVVHGEAEFFSRIDRLFHP